MPAYLPDPVPERHEAFERLLERLLVDAEFRARYLRDPAAAARVAGFGDLAAELAPPENRDSFPVSLESTPLLSSVPSRGPVDDMTPNGVASDITPATPPRRVVVGYDGLAGSRAVLEHAADAARADGVVFVVHAYAHPHSWLGSPNYQDGLDAVLAAAESTIRGLREQIGGPLDHVVWEPEIIGGDPAKVIASVAAARDADEIVVGGGRFGLARALHGSVAHDLLRLADVPVTVIPRGTAVEAA